MDAIRHIVGAYMQYIADTTNDLSTHLAKDQPNHGHEPTDAISMASSVQRMIDSMEKLSFIIHMLPQEARRLLIKSQFFQVKGGNPSTPWTIMDVPISKFCDGQNRQVDINHECGFSLW